MLAEYVDIVVESVQVSITVPSTVRETLSLPSVPRIRMSITLSPPVLTAAKLALRDWLALTLLKVYELMAPCDVPFTVTSATS